MTKHSITVECDVPDSFRVQQVAGLFDVPLASKLREKFSVEVPDVDEDWDIGVIVGPSGSGKSTVARHVYPDALYKPTRWPRDKAVVDALAGDDIKQITGMLTSVGFSSPPSWIKPYRVLSNGEQFRCDLARALLGDKPLIVFDEFTSVVDRTVAQIGSAAVSRAIRKGQIKRKFVAVTCHYDIVDWLEPDWVLDMASGKLARRRLRRPQIKLEVRRCHHSLWKMFKKHHYLSATLSKSCRCYVATIDDHAVGFCAAIACYGYQNKRRLSRTVVLPDFQGIGIGCQLSEAVASILTGEGKTVSAMTGHPGMIAHRRRSPLWKIRKIERHGRKSTGLAAELGHDASAMRARVAFEYVGP